MKIKIINFKYFLRKFILKKGTVDDIDVEINPTGKKSKKEELL